ncbi:hypothetical protein GUITHDRAFT_118120 [Guillardia theta CCMP2712]|uniref:Uncharacterized protein n=1 Tax=Guillardia theta (strain CCMP2712) TaxID=905079 RepID=L1IIU4_GUITC|nr:hypothetical protein GUITHDRAFT_118120 [Guillardia theta CCMP2712]EKX35735.1 hypothetical protein GUITHDRAFT_118120 [Guillardia theta CCMP2712]|eukprot:XP_005822715.1 hypothetical protein GUITHDRAFT_118120 [Guillardia theta CCMP2712]
MAHPMREHAYMVIPRRRRVAAPWNERTPAMSITRESLQRLFCMRQVHAARHLVRKIVVRFNHLVFDCVVDVQGISLTAFKNACKHLGYDRWPYQKEGDGASPSPINIHGWPESSGEGRTTDTEQAGEHEGDEFSAQPQSPAYPMLDCTSNIEQEITFSDTSEDLQCNSPANQENLSPWQEETTGLHGAEKPNEEEGQDVEVRLHRDWIEWFVGMGNDDPTIEW